MFQWLKSFNLDENNLRNFLEKAKSVGDITSQIADVDAQIEALIKKKEALAAAKAEAEKEITSFDHSKLFAQTETAKPAVAEAQEPAVAETVAEVQEPATKRPSAISVPEFLSVQQKRDSQTEPAVAETVAEVQEPAVVAAPEKKVEHSFVTNPAAFLAARRTLRTSTAQSDAEDPARQDPVPVSMSDFLNS